MSDYELKLRILKAHMASTINFYEEALSQSWPQVILSEAQREMLRIDFGILQNRMRRQEKTNSWQVLLEINFNDFDGTYRVGIIDESKLLYLD